MSTASSILASLTGNGGAIDFQDHTPTTPSQNTTDSNNPTHVIGGDDDDSDGGGGDLFSAGDGGGGEGGTTTTLGVSGFLSGSGLLGDPTPDSSSAVFGNGSRAMESSGLFEQVDEEKERQERFRREALKQERRMAEEREREDLLKREEVERQRVA